MLLSNAEYIWHYTILRKKKRFSILDEYLLTYFSDTWSQNSVINTGMSQKFCNILEVREAKFARSDGDEILRNKYRRNINMNLEWTWFPDLLVWNNPKEVNMSLKSISQSIIKSERAQLNITTSVIDNVLAKKKKCDTYYDESNVLQYFRRTWGTIWQL